MSLDVQLVNKNVHVVTLDAQLVNKDAPVVNLDVELVNKNAPVVSLDAQLVNKNAPVVSKYMRARLILRHYGVAFLLAVSLLSPPTCLYLPEGSHDDQVH